MRSGARKIAQGYAGSAIPRQNGGNPPASTVAAQIVENLTQVQYPAKQPDKEEFQRLLHEILNPDDDGDDVAEENIEINVDVNCRLIYVVVRAGLESLSSKNSLDDQYELHKQAIASLSVVQLTLRRSPEVLFSTFHGRDSHQPEVGPLYLWLIPRLFIILGSNRDEEICRCICEVLKTASMAEKASFKQIKFKLIQKYLQGCIKGQSIK
jgi:serine/threonine-protein kinase ATR